MCHEGSFIFWKWVYRSNISKKSADRAFWKGLQCKSGVEKKVYYYEQCVGQKILDLIVEDKVLVELKAMSELDRNSYNQVINYLKVFDLEVGLLINFGKQSLEFKRLVNYSKSA